MAEGILFRFDDFILDPEASELRRGDKVIALEPQVFDLIGFFVKNPGKLLSRDDLIDAVWNGRIVSDAAISTRMNGARNALGDNGKAQRVIKTVSRRGFRFLPKVTIEKIGEAVAEPGADAACDLPLPSRPSIVVMPFTVPGEDPESRSMADGLRIDIQNALIKVSGLFLSAIGAANAVSVLDDVEAARRLGVQYIIHGQVRRSRTMARYSIQLVDAVNDRIIWTANYDREIADTFAVLDEVTGEVLTSLNVKLVAGEQARFWHKTLRDFNSLEVFYRGISNFFAMNAASLTIARQDFEKIAEWHADNPLGPTWVSLTHWYDFQRGWSQNPDASRKLARDWAERAVKYTDADGQACTVLSHVYLLDGDFDAALDAGRAAIANRPNCTHANAFFANVLHHCGHHADAEKHIMLAIRFSPVHPPLFNYILAAILRAKGELAPASTAIEEALRTNCDDVSANVLASVIAAQLGDVARAQHHRETVGLHEPDFAASFWLEQQNYRDPEFVREFGFALRAAGFAV